MLVWDKDQLQLANAGYCTITDVLSTKLLDKLRERFGANRLKQTAPQNFGMSGAFVKLDYRELVVARLLALPKTLAILKRFGFAQPKLHSFYVSTKPPKAKELPWHSDLFYEYTGTAPAELFLIYSLQDTNQKNGCLRVIPGSHLDTQTKHEPVDVPVKAGDLFTIGMLTELWFFNNRRHLAVNITLPLFD